MIVQRIVLSLVCKERTTAEIDRHNTDCCPCTHEQNQPQKLLKIIQVIRITVICICIIIIVIVKAVVKSVVCILIVIVIAIIILREELRV